MGGIKKGLEKATLASAKVLAKAQTGIDRVLWGKDAMIYSAQQGVSGSASVTAAKKTAAVNTNSKMPKPKNPLELGLLPILDIIISVDLCNIIDYLASTVGGKVPKKRPENPNSIEEALYFVQDKALFVQNAIDTFLASPTALIGRYTGLDPKIVSQREIAEITNQPLPAQGNLTVVPGQSTSGTNTQRYNVVNLLNYIRGTFADGIAVIDGKSVFTPEDQELLTSVPGLSTNLNIVNDFLAGITTKYADYRNIPDKDLQKLLAQITTLRTICVVIQGLDLRNPASYLTLTAAVYPPESVRGQIAKLQKWINPQGIIPVVKQINDATKSFIGIVQQSQKILAQGQFIIKIALLLIKVFKAIVAFLKKLPIPGMSTTVGANVTFSSIANKIEKVIDEVTEILAQVNSLLAVVVSFLRYVQANTLQLIDRLENLLGTLASCDSTKDSPVVAQLATTVANLKTLNTQISDYLTLYDDKTDPSKAIFGIYSIRVIDEEVTDKSIPNKRRRGIALDKNGFIAVQSDLTFATDVRIIIQEVKLKLLSAGLIQPGLGGIDADIIIISDSLSFLETNDIIQDDLNLGNTGESIGLNDFLDNLPGGKALKQRVRSNLDSKKAAFADKVKREKINTSKIFKK